jgi:hypothetical protein
MSPAQASTIDLFNTPQVQHCLLCRRVRWFHQEQDSPTEWKELTGFLTQYGLTLSSLVVVDAYCETCETFYRQLVTYGQPGQQITGSTTSG